jgi:hypothetical protein
MPRSIDLTKTLLTLEPDDAVILSHRTRYVQFLRGEDALFVESVDNEFLPDDDQLDQAAEQALIDLGWRPPGDADNWNTELPWPAPDQQTVTQVADLVLRTLQEVHRISVDELSYEAFNTRTGTSHVPPGLEQLPASGS